MGVEYPKREPFFAHKFVRLLTKSCAAQDIGLNAFALLCVIVHQEDSARYCGPVRFWNEQLMSTLSLSPRALRDARDKAIEFGWLVYFREHDRATGRYFVTVPEQFSGLSDAPIEEPCAVRGEVSGDASGANLHKEVTSNCTTKRPGSAPEPSPPSIPIPNPIPTYSPGDEIQIPEKLNKPEVMRVAGLWFRHLELKDKPEKIPPRNSPQEQAWWSQVAKLGADKFLTMAEKAMAEGWVTLRDTGQSAGSSSPGQSSEWLAALKAAKSFPKPDDWEKRKKALGDELFEALKRTGSRAVAESTDWEQKTLKELFESHLRDIRNGTTVGN